MTEIKFSQHNSHNCSKTNSLHLITSIFLERTTKITEALLTANIADHVSTKQGGSREAVLSTGFCNISQNCKKNFGIFSEKPSVHCDSNLYELAKMNNVFCLLSTRIYTA